MRLAKIGQQGQELLILRIAGPDTSIEALRRRYTKLNGVCLEINKTLDDADLAIPKRHDSNLIK